MQVVSGDRKGTIKKTSQLAEQKFKDASRPPDECPWPRPFRDDFHECPVFAPLLFRPTDSRDRPLGAALTCRHLVSRPFDQPKAGWYGACDLGDAAARRAYLKSEVFGGF